MAASAVRRAAAPPALLCAGLAAAVVLRSALAGAAGPRSAAAGALFGGVLLAIAVSAAWRPGRLSLRGAAIGVCGAALLLAVPFVLHLRALPLATSSPAGDLALWAAVVTLVACAEEALLRGAIMEALLRVTSRPELAVAVAAVAFAMLHVPLYGWAALPLDLGVGVWLGGLRLWSGGAGAPAIAHSVADLCSWWLR